MIENVRKFRLKQALRQKGQGGLKRRFGEHLVELQEPQMSLLKQSRYLDAFFQHSLTPLVFLDREFNFIRVNEAYARAGQKEVADFPGHNHFEFYPSDAKAIFEEVVRTKQPFQISARPFVYPDHPEWGVTYWDWTLTPLFDDNGEVEILVFALEDVTTQKRAEIELENYRKHLQETNSRLHELTKQMMTTLEEERRMISRELHDEAGQALTALKMYIELILKGVSADAIELRQRISEAVKLTAQALNDIRRLAQDLRPPGLDALGLNFTLEDFCYEFSKRVGLEIKYQGCSLPVLSGIVRISLYRFLQEALTNVVKHAKASSVQVYLDYHHGQISLAVKDNGIGFELNNVKIKPKGIGLVGMGERLAMLGGFLAIDSKPGQGTRLKATIPWEVAGNDPDINR
jgi:PAS domain S-box-containing protein